MATLRGRFRERDHLREIERGQIFIDLVEGTDTDVGLVFRVFLPGGGTVIADVGRLVFDAEGNVLPPCHSCAISQGESRYRADNHGPAMSPMT